MAKSLNIVPEKCTGCMQCELACSWVQTGSFQPSRSLIRVNVFDEEASYAPYTCLQCDEAWCMNVCPVNAIGVDDATGSKVVIDSLCIGCHLCTIACPFGTVFTTPQSTRRPSATSAAATPLVQPPAPTDAIEFVELTDPGGWFEPWGDRVQENYAAATAH